VKAIRSALAALALAPVVGACGGDGGEIFGPEARAAADSFVRALVANGNVELARDHATGEARESAELWHAYLVRQGVRTVEGPGSARANCIKAFPVFAPPPPEDCIVYRLRGLMPIPSSNRTLVTIARFRVWPSETDAGWRVADFEYTPQIEAR
jgi:hypothetical protein